jgi:ribonuclease HII
MAKRGVVFEPPAGGLFPSLLDGLMRLDREASIGNVEEWLAAQGVTEVIGVDEAGRGPLAGPVMVCAVRMDLTSRALWLREGLDDSKKLSESERERLARLIGTSLQTCVVEMSACDVDERNVLGASLEGMRRAVSGLRAPSGVIVLVDGNRRVPSLPHEQATLVRGDGRSLAIAAASVVAKQTRDARMAELGERYPGYGFAQHKGYPVPQHLRALEELGVTPEHRRSFAPVARRLLSGENASES